MSIPIFNSPPRQSTRGRSRFMLLALLGIAAFGAACASPASTPSGADAAASSAAPAVDAAAPAEAADPIAAAYRRLQKGMTAPQVKALLGEPVEVKPFESEGIANEIWIYTRSFPGPTRQTAAEMVDVPYVDPISGVAGNLKTPFYRLEKSLVTETTRLLLIRGVLVEWNQQREVDRSFY